MTTVPELLKLSQNLSVLYVEDDSNIRREMHEMLNDLFGVVILAYDGEDGLAKFTSYKRETGKYPDIIITDINMPNCNGIEMSKKILERHVEQLIIILSAHNESHYLLELINMGIDYYLTKPMDPVQFLQTMQRAAKKIYYKNMELRYTQELEKLAYQDSMTGISNRRRFFEKAKTLFSKEGFLYSPIYLFMFDIDKFKSINDTYGHDMGDEVIRVFVDSIEKEISKNDCFARVGGDEFVLMIQSSIENVLHVIGKIQAHINKTHFIQNQSIAFSVSIGMTEITQKDDNIDAVMKRADIDLYKEKETLKDLLRA